MSKQVVSKISYTYGSITGYVDNLSVTSCTVPDQDDYNELERSLKSRIEKLEKKMHDLEIQNNALLSIVKDSLSELESINMNGADQISEIIKQSDERVKEYLKDK